MIRMLKTKPIFKAEKSSELKLVNEKLTSRTI